MSLVFMDYTDSMSHEKRTSSLPAIRVCETLEMELRRLADADGRLLSDYMRRVLELHCFGHAHIVAQERADGNNIRALQCDAG